jgi:hypothetical protein
VHRDARLQTDGDQLNEVAEFHVQVVYAACTERSDRPPGRRDPFTG